MLPAASVVTTANASRVAASPLLYYTSPSLNEYDWIKPEISAVFKLGAKGAAVVKLPVCLIAAVKLPQVGVAHGGVNGVRVV